MASSPLDGVLGGKTCAYRWHVADPIVFQKRLKVAIERMGWIAIDENPDHKSISWNERQDDYSSVAFWYQVGEPKRFATVPPCAERRLPEIDTIVRGSGFTARRYHGAGDAVVQRGRYWTDHAQMLYKPPSQEDAWVEIPFEDGIFVRVRRGAAAEEDEVVGAGVRDGVAGVGRDEDGVEWADVAGLVADGDAAGAGEDVVDLLGPGMAMRLGGAAGRDEGLGEALAGRRGVRAVEQRADGRAVLGGEGGAVVAVDDFHGSLSRAGRDGLWG